MPHVRLSVRGPNKTGEALECFYFIDHQIRAASRKSNRKISFSAHVRSGERGAPVQLLMGSARPRLQQFRTTVLTQTTAA